MLLSVLLGFYIFCVAVQCYYYLYYFTAIPKYTATVNEKSNQAVSVIIAVQNEEENLKHFLPLILSQSFENYEVVVVNNHSTDSTMHVLQALKNDRLKVFDYTEQQGKKAAIQFGIEKASYDYFVFTDADCKVTSSDWLRLMVANFNNSKEIVVGYAGFFKEKGFLNRLIRYESFLNALQSFSFAIKGVGYTAVGRNMGYTREIYKRSNAFRNHAQLRSGDDDLIVNEMASAGNVGVILNPSAHTYTKAESTFSAYFNQRRRQLQAGKVYRTADKLRLALFGATNFQYYFMLIVLLLVEANILLVLSIFLFKQFIQFVVFYLSSKKTKDGDLIKWIVFIEPIYMFIIAVIGVSTWIRKVDKWK